MSIGTLVDTIRLARRSAPLSALGQPGMNQIELRKARIRYLDTGGSGRPVVIAPDPPNTIEHHLDMVAALQGKHRVIVFDLPGFGFSYPRMGFSFNVSEYCDLIVELLEELDVNNSTLVFSCLPSFPALSAAARLPERVAQLVLAQAPSFEDALDWAQRIDDRHILGTPILGQMMMATIGPKVANEWYHAALPRGSDVSDFFGPAKTMLDAGGCYCLASAFQRFKHADISLLTGVEQPVSVYWGALDRTHHTSDPEGILKHIPHADVHVLKECGHFPDLEYTSELISAILP